MKSKNEFIRQARMEELWRKWEHNIQRLPKQLVMSSRTWSENLDHLGLKGLEVKKMERSGDEAMGSYEAAIILPLTDAFSAQTLLIDHRTLLCSTRTRL